MTCLQSLIIRRLRTWIAFPACLVAFGCSDSTPPTPPTPPPPVPPILLPITNRIVFQSNRSDPLFDIWIMNADGTGSRQLSDTTSRDECASLSPDGNWIAFHQLSKAKALAPISPGNQDSLVLMKADGTNRVALAQLERYATVGVFCPIWSAQSDRILTVSATEESRVRSNQNFRARVIDRTGQVIATADVAAGQTLRAISLSPDGTRLLVSAANNSTAGPPVEFRVYSMRIDGTDRQVIGQGENGDGTWSPAGNAIAWNCFGVCVADPNGGNTRTLRSESSSFPTGNNIRFSPNGEYLAFGCKQSSNPARSLCIATVTTGAIEEIKTLGEIGHLSWMADNTTLVFECSSPAPDICVTKRGTGTSIKLTDDGLQDSEPSAR